jgi:hypothetical protein
MKHELGEPNKEDRSISCKKCNKRWEIPPYAIGDDGKLLKEGSVHLLLTHIDKQECTAK